MLSIACGIFFPLKENENVKTRTNYIEIYKMSIGQFNQPFEDWEKKRLHFVAGLV